MRCPTFFQGRLFQPAVVSFCLLVFFLSAPSQTSSSGERDTADTVGRELILSAIKGMGGLKPLRGLRTLSILSTSKQSTPQGDISLTTKVSVNQFRMLRQDTVSTFGSVAMLYDGNDAWQVTAEETQGLNEVTLRQLRKRLARSLGRLLLEAYDGRRTAELLTVKNSSEETDEILVVDAAGDRVVLTIARESGQVTRIAYETLTVTGEPVEEVELRSDFRPVGGLVLPFKIVTFRQGKKLRETTVHDYAFNEPMPASLFTPAGNRVEVP